MTDQTTAPEPFRFTDADGDYLHIGIPNSPTGGSPAVSFHTMAEPVHVPVEELEGLIAAVRSMAAVQAPAARLPVSEARTRLLQALDAPYCQALGFTPEGLLAAYEASRTQTVDQAALRDPIAAAIWERQNPGRRWADCEYRWRADAEEDADAVLAVLPAPVDQAALSAKLWEIAERHIVAEWICCEPLEPGHDLCAKGYAALGMVKSLLVDADPGEAWNPSRAAAVRAHRRAARDHQPRHRHGARRYVLRAVPRPR